MCLDFGIEQAASCNWDWLELRTDGIPIGGGSGKFCGDGGELPGSIEIYDGPVTVQFRSDSSANDVGFSLTYEILEPGKCALKI